MSTTTKRDEMSKAPYRETLIWQGKKYVLEEIEAGEFDEIEKQATKKELDPASGEMRETIDGAFQNRLLLNRMLVEGMPRRGPDKLPMRHAFLLRRKITEMCFGDLPNEFKAGDEPDEEETEAKGEG